MFVHLDFFIIIFKENYVRNIEKDDKISLFYWSYFWVICEDKASVKDFVAVPVDSDIVGFKVVDLLHVLFAKLKVVDIYVLLNVLWVFWTRDNYEVMLHGPS